MKLPTISVENFGPIRKGTVELRPLTIFIGQSDTGKSWLATLIYSLYSATDFHSLVWYTSETLNKLSSTKIDEKYIKFPDSIALWLDAIENNESVSFSNSEYSLLTECFVQASLQTIFETERCFGVERYSLLESWHTKKSTKVEVSSSISNGRQYPLFENITKNDRISTNIFFPKTVNFSKDPFLREVIYKLLIEYRDYGQRQTLERLIKNVLLYTYRQTMNAKGSVYLPSGRVGLIDNFRSLFPFLAEKYVGEYEEESTTDKFIYGVVGDFIASLAKITSINTENRDPRILETANRIERSLLGGKVEIQPNIDGMPNFHFKPREGNESAPLKVSSSKVKQLAPLAIFLRYILDKESLLIISEPEIHLHPSKQVELVDELALLVKEGYKILITTHSEWLTEALSNVIAFESKKSDPMITEEDVGVWNFEHRGKKRGSVIKEIEWSTDMGGYQTEFEGVSRRLYNEWVNAVEDDQ